VSFCLRRIRLHRVLPNRGAVFLHLHACMAVADCLCALRSSRCSRCNANLLLLLLPQWTPNSHGLHANGAGRVDTMHALTLRETRCTAERRGVKCGDGEHVTCPLGKALC